MTPTQVFELPLAPASAWLELPCSAPGEGLAQARVLAAALPALAGLESWLAADLPCPEPAQDSVASAARGVSASDLRLAFDSSSLLAGGHLTLPWQALKPGRSAPAALPVQWPQWPVCVRLQVLPARRVPASGLVVGAVLLLPASFRAPWAVQLQAAVPFMHAAPAGWQVAAEWRPQEARLDLTGGPVQPAADRAAPEAWSVWLSAPQSVDLRAWFGGCAVAASLPVGPAELRLGDQTVAWGRLLPCGAGWGLRIEQVESLELAAAWT